MNIKKYYMEIIYMIIIIITAFIIMHMVLEVGTLLSYCLGFLYSLVGFLYIVSWILSIYKKECNTHDRKNEHNKQKRRI